MTRRTSLWTCGFLALLLAFAPGLLQAREQLSVLHTWEPAFQQRQDEFDRMFSERHPEIEIVSESVTWSGLPERLAVRIAGGVAPDLVYVHYSWAQGFIDQGLLANLQPYLSRDAAEMDFGDFIEVGLEPFRDRKGDIHALPYDIGPMVLYYDVVAFERAGLAPPDLTWTLQDDFVSAPRS